MNEAIRLALIWRAAGGNNQSKPHFKISQVSRSVRVTVLRLIDGELSQRTSIRKHDDTVLPDGIILQIYVTRSHLINLTRR